MKCSVNHCFYDVLQIFDPKHSVIHLWHKDSLYRHFRDRSKCNLPGNHHYLSYYFIKASGTGIEKELLLCYLFEEVQWNWAGEHYTSMLCLPLELPSRKGISAQTLLDNFILTLHSSSFLFFISGLANG